MTKSRNTTLFTPIEFVTTSKVTQTMGISYPLKKDSQGGFFTKETDHFLIKNNLRQLILTERGERPMQPSFGVQLRSKLFEPLDSFLLNGIKEDIRETIAIYDKRIRITSLLVEEDVSLRSRGLNKIYIKLSFVIKDFPTFVDTLEITI